MWGVGVWESATLARWIVSRTNNNMNQRFNPEMIDKYTRKIKLSETQNTMKLPLQKAALPCACALYLTSTAQDKAGSL